MLLISELFLEKMNLIFWILSTYIFSLSVLLMTSQKKYSKKITGPLIALFSVITLGSNIIYFYNKGISSFEANNVITILIPQVILVLIIGKHKLSSIASALHIYLAIYALSILKSSINRYIPDVYQFIDYIYVLFFPIIWLYVKYFYIDFNNELEKNNYNLIKFILLYSLIAYLEIYFYSLLLQNSTKNALRIEIFGIAILSIYYISFFIFYVILSQFKKRLLELNKEEIKSHELLHLEDRIKVRETKDKELKILRHDLRHLLITINQCIKDGNLNEALKLISSYIEQVDKTSTFTYCHDYMIDSIIDYYSTICKKNNIEFNINVNSFEPFLKIPSNEVSILISNCLENAVNATKKLNSNKRIDFTFKNNQGRLILKVQNTYNGKIKLDSDFSPTTKKKNHGLGTNSIQWFANKYNLILDYKTDNNIFSVTILFN